jgi:hypothetical protein
MISWRGSVCIYYAGRQINRQTHTCANLNQTLTMASSAGLALLPPHKPPSPMAAALAQHAKAMREGKFAMGRARRWGRWPA